MDPERKAWLDRFFKKMTVDVVGQMKDLVEVLKLPEDDLKQWRDQCLALEAARQRRKEEEERKMEEAYQRAKEESARLKAEKEKQKQQESKGATTAATMGLTVTSITPAEMTVLPSSTAPAAVTASTTTTSTTTTAAPPAETKEAKDSKDSTDSKAAVNGDIAAGGAAGDDSESSLLSFMAARKAAVLEALEDLVDKIDFAQDLHKIGGFVPLLKQLDSRLPAVRWRAAQAVSTVVQNNPFGQSAALELGALPVLLQRWETPSSAAAGSDEVKVAAKAILAVSSLIRSHKDAEAAFVKARGLVRLVKAVGSPHVEVKRKALSLLHWALRTNAKHRSTVRALQIAPLLTALIGHDDVDVREMAAKCVLDCVIDGRDKDEQKLADFGKANTKEVASKRVAAISALTDSDDIAQAATELKVLRKIVKRL